MNMISSILIKIPLLILIFSLAMTYNLLSLAELFKKNNLYIL